MLQWVRKLFGQKEPEGNKQAIAREFVELLDQEMIHLAASGLSAERIAESATNTVGNILSKKYNMTTDELVRCLDGAKKYLRLPPGTF